MYHNQTLEINYKDSFKKVQNSLEDAYNYCQGLGNDDYFVTIIDYYGPGCKAVGESKDWIAIIPEFNGEKFQLRYVNLDKWAHKFATKKNTITLIFNHASTAELEHYDEKTAINDYRFRFYQNDIIGG